MKKYIIVILLIIAIATTLWACDGITPEAVQEITGSLDAGKNNNAGDPYAPAPSGATDTNTSETKTTEPASGESADKAAEGDGAGTSSGMYETSDVFKESGSIYYDGCVISSASGKGGIPMGSSGDVGGTTGGEDKEDEKDTPRAGLLTVCAYDDHEFFDYWKGLLTTSQEGVGEFAEYYEEYAFKAYQQIKVTVEGEAGQLVALLKDNVAISLTRTDNAGVAYLYAPSDMDGLQVATSFKLLDCETIKPVVNNEVTFTKEEIGEYGSGNKFDRVEIMFVIDTTGSMGDEITYLKAEIADVIDRIQAQTEASVLLSLMVYRDEGDEYVTLYSDFTTDIKMQQGFLSKQYANGGGDFPEAVQTAMTEAVSKQWSANATKIIVHVADAPSHDEDVSAWNEAVKTATEKGIRIVSVASSGIDKKTEYFFRSQSLLTGGVYLYLTNDSGIGGDHLEGTVYKRPVVEALNDSLVRVITALHKGEGAITILPEEPQEPDTPVQDEQQTSIEKETAE